MTPAAYGYHPCVRCRCLRPGVGAVNESEVRSAMGEPTPLELALAEVSR